MNIQTYLSNMQTIQSSILSYIDDKIMSTEKYTKIINLFDNFKIRSNKNTLELILQMIINISINHFRGPNFFEKIEKILINLKNDIINNFSVESIVKMFIKSYRILLFLLNEKIVYFSKETVTYDIPKYFFVEAEKNQLICYIYDYQSLVQKYTKDHKKNQLIGENHHTLCQLIRNDSIDEFIKLYKKKKCSYDESVEDSIYETNYMLYNHDCNYIEYAAFFGSIKIFKFLLEEKESKDYYDKLNKHILKYAIHGRNIEIIHLLENSNVKKNKSYELLMKSAIMCYDFEIMKYIQDKYQENNRSFQKVFPKCIKYFNFISMNERLISDSYLYFFCEYNYIFFVEYILKKPNADVNQFKYFFFKYKKF